MTQQQKAVLELLGFQVTHRQEDIMRMIFHRPPTLQLSGITVASGIQRAIYFPPPEIFEGHHIRGMGNVHPGWILGEYASQAGLALALLSQQFLGDSTLQGRCSIPMATLHQGTVRFWDEGVQPNDIVLFHLVNVDFSETDKFKDKWRMLDGTISATALKFRDGASRSVEVSEYDITGPVYLGKSPLRI